MESKITIDIRPTGEPFLYIDFKATDDLRDKVISRFLFESGGLRRLTDGTLPNPTPLDLHVLWYDEEKQRIQAMIEIPAVERSEAAPHPLPHPLKLADDWAVENLSTELYKKWRKDIFGQERR